MTQDIAGIDHLLIGVGDLEAAAERYRRLGFTLTPLGRHRAKNTGNVCIMFGADYLELKGVVDRDAPDEGFDALFAARGEGLQGVAFAGPAGRAAVERWRQAGVAASEPLALTRDVETAAGTEELRFTRIRFPETAALGLGGFVCQHLTPELTRRPAWLAHANGAEGIAGLTVVVAAPAAGRGLCEKLFGAEKVRDDAGGLVIRTGPAEIRIVGRAGWPDWEWPAPPFVAGATLRVADLESAAASLRGQGVAHRMTGAGLLRVPPEETCGVLLDFVGPT